MFSQDPNIMKYSLKIQILFQIWPNNNFLLPQFMSVARTRSNASWTIHCYLRGHHRRHTQWRKGTTPAKAHSGQRQRQIVVIICVHTSGTRSPATLQKHKDSKYNLGLTSHNDTYCIKSQNLKTPPPLPPHPSHYSHLLLGIWAKSDN